MARINHISQELSRKQHDNDKSTESLFGLSIPTLGHTMGPPIFLPMNEIMQIGISYTMRCPQSIVIDKNINNTHR